MRAYKFLDHQGRAPFTLTPWPVGEWVEAVAVVPCRAGVHACGLEDLSYWLAKELWEIELEAPVIRAGHKLVARRGRLVAPVEAYPEAAWELGEICAWRACDRAVIACRAEGAQATAELLARASTLEALVTLDGGLDDTTAAGTATGLAVDAARFALRGPISEAPFVASCSAGHLAAGLNGDQGVFDAAYVEERAFQSSWLAARLALAGAGS
jgi:hypothetical protein